MAPVATQRPSFLTTSKVQHVIKTNYRKHVGKWTALTIQQTAVGSITEELGDDLYKHYEGSGTKSTRLASAIKNAANLSSAGEQTIRRWFNHFLSFGELPEETSRRRKGREPRANASSFTQEDTQELVALFSNSPELYLDEIQEYMMMARGRRWNTSTLWRKMTELGYSLQVATQQAKQIDEDERTMYKEVFEQIVDLNHLDQLIFLDETHRSKLSSRRRRHWSKRGRTPVRQDNYYGSFDPRYTMIAAADINGFVLDTCDVIEREHGKNDKDPTRGTVNQQRFEIWVKECLVPVLGRFEHKEKRSIVILDNASIHHSNRVVEMIEDAGAYVLWLPPYSPDFNPIEQMFHLYKMSLRRTQQMDWLDAHSIALRAADPTNARAAFGHCLKAMGIKHEFVESGMAAKKDSAAVTNFFSLCALYDPLPLYFTAKAMGHIKY